MSRTVRVVLEAVVEGYKRKMAEGAEATDKVADAAEKTGAAVEGAAKKSKSFGDTVRGMGKAVEREFEAMQDAALANEQAWSGVQNHIALVGAAAGGVVALASREFSQFDQAMSGVASTGDDAKQSIEALRAAAIESGADTAFSATEAAQGIEELARAGVDAESVLAGGLAGALDLAAAGQIGVAEAAGIASTAMTQFKLSGDQIPHLADLLAAGAGKAMGGVDDLGQALSQSGLVASQFGLSIEETVGGLSAFAAAGLLGSDAGTSMKAMLLSLANPAGKTAKVMQELGIEAYNAQGQFIGLEGLAGVLQDRLAHLTDQQRQQALAQIFGTDAIRAASILYEQGAEGIAQWTEAVNDSGYASETAAELQNNLIGDLEKLGGSWSTLAIQMGEAADGPLRLATQGLTGLLDVAGESPAIAGGIMLTATSIGALALGAAGLMKGISTYAQFRTHLAELTELNPRIGKTADVIGKVGKAAAITAVAFASVMAAKGIINMLDGTATGADNAAAALERLRQGTGDLDSVFQTTSGGTLVAFVNDLDSAMARYADRGLKYMDGLDEFMGGLTGQASDLQQIRDQFALLDAEISGMDAADAAEQFTMIRDRAKEVGMPVEDLIALMPQYAGQIQRLAAENGVAELSGNLLADAMEGVYPPLMQAMAAAGVLGPAAQEAATGMAVLEGATAEVETRMLAFSDGMVAIEEDFADWIEMVSASSSSFVDLMGAYDGVIAKNKEQAQATADGTKSSADSWEDYYDGVSVTMEELAAVLDEQIEAQTNWQSNMTELAGRASQGMLDYLAELGPEGAALVQDLANATDEELAGMEERFRESGMIAGNDWAAQFAAQQTVFAAVGAKAGDAAMQSAAAAVASGEATLADIIAQYDLEAEIGADTNPAIQQAMDAVRRINMMKAAIHVDVSGGSGVSPAMARSAQGVIPGRADGGPIWGPGTSTSDSILMWGSNGEFMLRTWAAQKIGYDRLAYMNRTGELPAFRDGGRVGMPSHATAGALSAPRTAGASVYNDNRSYSYEGREALAYVIAHTRDADLNRYATQGVHG